jgi:hypothetical protein
MWIVLADQNIFSTTRGQVLVMISIPTHYALGFLLVRAIRRAPAARYESRPSTRSAIPHTALPEATTKT